MPPDHNAIASENPAAKNTAAAAPAAVKVASWKSDSQFRNFALGTAILAVVCSLPLLKLFSFALGEDMYSFMVLMPAVTVYLFNVKKPWQIKAEEPLKALGGFFLFAGVALAGLCYLLLKSNYGLEKEEALDLSTGSFLLGLVGVSLITLGWERFKACGFPLAMLIFLLPIPENAYEDMVRFLQYGSAYVADAMFHAVGTNCTLHDLTFSLPPTPGIRVAPECSGIHSTYILLITSFLAGYLFLRSPWRRTALVAFVVPLALVRNGFRIFTIGELCLRYGMQMIDSWIHRKGGPFFFVLSLIPFFIFLAWLRSREKRSLAPTDSTAR